MKVRLGLTATTCAAFVLAALPAYAQYGRRGSSEPATGENYHIEASGNLWTPTPTLLITSESLGIVGDQIDFVQDFGLENKTFKQLKFVLKPARKHKLRYEYTPIRYEQTANLTRPLVFNGQRFNVTLPVLAELKWNAMRFGYEYDFLYKERGYLGLLLEAKYTDVEAALTNALIGREFAAAKAPVPAIGVSGRGYVLPNVSISGEWSLFKLPGSINEDYKASYYDFDLYGTVNFTNNFGAQAGYRRMTVFYKVETDTGDMKMKGLYFGGVIRY